MATPQSVITAIRTAVQTLTSATQCSSDYWDKYDKVGDGLKKYQLRAICVGTSPDSNETHTVMQIEVALLRDIVPGANGGTEEATYTGGNLQTFALSLTKRTWWRAISGIRDVIDGPDASVQRDGNLIIATFSVRITLD